MIFKPPLKEAVLIRRYKRFLADIETPDGQILTIHCPNTGSMMNCSAQGSRVWYSKSANPKRKYPHTLEIVETEHGHKVGINTGSANGLVAEAIKNQTVSELAGYNTMRREVPYGSERSRIDLLLGDSSDQQHDCYVEIKNVSLGMGAGLGVFPDAVSSRGQKHLRELMQVRAAGFRSVLLFCVQHEGIKCVAPADQIDPLYGKLLRQAASCGVELLAYGATLNPDTIKITQPLAVELPAL